jgi:hypothetical protein
MATALVWIAVGFATSACVAKPAFRCQSDESCVNADGSRGTCETNGECTFHPGAADQGGASGTAGASEAGGAGASTAGTAGSGNNSSNGGDGGSAAGVGAAGDDAMGDAGAPCTDEAANGCYACRAKTSAQLLNACTSSMCVPFDDHARLKNLPTSGELPPLPPAVGQ